uniref:EST1_DNA_bind domain-containing protein n=1 Tax=Syphacia muris TaxID=451379 RepID=A0A0N5ARG3_9BILA
MPERATGEVWSAIKELQSLPNGERNEYTYRLPLIKLLEELFITDIEYAYEKKADILFFTTQKESLEHLKSQFDRKATYHNSAEKNYVNALNQCFCELVELALLVQEKYGFVIDELPPPFSVFSDTSAKYDNFEKLNDVLRNKFINFVCLRLGDISRYLLDYNTARMFYERSVKACPTDGQAYNQIGLIETAAHDSLDALFWHVCAINTLEPFTPAAANIENLYKKFFSVNLLETTDHFITRLSELLRSENVNIIRLGMHFVILVSIWNNMVNSTSEIKCADYIASVISDQFFYIIERFVNDQYINDEKSKVLSVIWIFASWLDEKKVAVAKKAPKEAPWLEYFAKFLDTLKTEKEFKNEVEPLQYFCPLASFNFKNVDAMSLFLRMKSIFYRILRFYRISETPDADFLAFFKENHDLFVEERRMRTSHTVPILSSL